MMQRYFGSVGCGKKAANTPTPLSTHEEVRGGLTHACTQMMQRYFGCVGCERGLGYKIISSYLLHSSSPNSDIELFYQKHTPTLCNCHEILGLYKSAVQAD